MKAYLDNSQVSISLLALTNRAHGYVVQETAIRNKLGMHWHRVQVRIGRAEITRFMFHAYLQSSLMMQIDTHARPAAATGAERPRSQFGRVNPSPSSQCTVCVEETVGQVTVARRSISHLPRVRHASVELLKRAYSPCMCLL